MVQLPGSVPSAPGLTVIAPRASGALRDLAPQTAERTPLCSGQVTVDGKFLSLDGNPFRVRGVTYGSFRPRGDGELFPEPAGIHADFAAMADAGLNTVRTYTLPPVDLLELAAEAGLRVLVGLHYRDWRLEQSSGLRARHRVLDAGRRAVEAALERCDGRSEVLAVAVGNEVPGDLVRLHGINAVEKTLSSLVAQIHAASSLLATYVNYPTTEYLHVDDQDLACFNVFLEQPDELKAYLRHLQVVAGEVPLLISELGLASSVHGAEAQADSLAHQLLITDESGCAGATVFSWTDEWAVGGRDVDGWGFGVTDASRRPKPSLGVLRTWARADIRSLRARWPSVSVVVCAHNEADLVERCLASLAECPYPDLEVVFCDDGSTDETLEIARRFPFRVLALPHGGLSRARNAGIEAATGEVVAFLDADAECHPDWPYHLVVSLEDEHAVATGGPNLPPPDRPFVERAVALAPGAPVHVLVKDDRAEHVPGCNMAFRKSALEEIQGFDAVYTSAGDDVDVCWRLLDLGHEIAFAPAAQVRHHRPASIWEYLRQQRSYGRAERMLAGRHRHRFNTLGQARWSGFIYTGPPILRTLLRPTVYHGPMGIAPFQKITRRRSQELVARVTPLVRSPSRQRSWACSASCRSGGSPRRPRRSLRSSPSPGRLPLRSGPAARSPIRSHSAPSSACSTWLSRSCARGAGCAGAGRPLYRLRLPGAATVSPGYSASSASSIRAAVSSGPATRPRAGTSPSPSGLCSPAGSRLRSSGTGPHACGSRSGRDSRPSSSSRRPAS